MLLTPDQIQELVDIIDRNHLTFIVQHVGYDILSTQDLSTLEKYGVNLEQLKSNPSYIETAYKFGILSDALKKTQAKNLKFSQIKTQLTSNSFLPLSTLEKDALDNLKYQAYSDIKGLGNKISQDMQSIAIEADQDKRKKYEKTIQEEAEKVIEERGSIQQMVSNLGHKTEDWNRDFGRISDYILHTAFDNGRAAKFEREGGEDVLVYKDVYAGACKHCIRLYTTGGIGSTPIIFKLSELKANGTNVGRKVHEWKPVIGGTHPWCRCTLNNVPKGFKWDEETRDFSKLEDTWERKVERKSKISVTIGDEQTFV